MSKRIKVNEIEFISKDVAVVDSCLISKLSGADLAKLTYMANNRALVVRDDIKIEIPDEYNKGDIECFKVTEYDYVTLAQYLASVINYKVRGIYTYSDMEFSLYCNNDRLYFDKAMEAIIDKYDVEIDFIF